MEVWTKNGDGYIKKRLVLSTGEPIVYCFGTLIPLRKLLLEAMRQNAGQPFLVVFSKEEKWEFERIAKQFLDPPAGFHGLVDSLLGLDRESMKSCYFNPTPEAPPQLAIQFER